MAHDFKGTFNKSQFTRFLDFARSQLPLVDGRIAHLKAEVGRLGQVVFRYQNGVPQGYAGDPPESYLGKLLGAYEVLGGNPAIDLRVRLNEDPVFMLRGTETSGPQFMSNGEVIGDKGLADAPSADLLHQARNWVDGTIRTRFDRLERKIRRVMDYSDQLQKEIDTLTAIKQAATSEGSLEAIANQISQLINDPNYRAIFDDNGKDLFGMTTYAPFSAYDANASKGDQGVSRSNDQAQRQNSGYVGPGETGPAT